MNASGCSRGQLAGELELRRRDEVAAKRGVIA